MNQHYYYPIISPLQMLHKWRLTGDLGSMFAGVIGGVWVSDGFGEEEVVVMVRKGHDRPILVARHFLRWYFLSFWWRGRRCRPPSFFLETKAKKMWEKNGIDSMVQQGACCMDFPRPSWLRTFEQKGIQKDRIANVRGRMKIQEKNSRNHFFLQKRLLDLQLWSDG